MLLVEVVLEVIKQVDLPPLEEALVLQIPAQPIRAHQIQAAVVEDYQEADQLPLVQVALD
jgi:hypothetical protein